MLSLSKTKFTSPEKNYGKRGAKKYISDEMDNYVKACRVCVDTYSRSKAKRIHFENS